MKTVLTIAGSDCSGGAGIQADLKTIAAHKLYGMSAITALTAQNTTGVYGVHEPPAEFLAQQLDCIFTDIFPDAVKIGMVSSETIINVIVDKLKQYGARNIVVDPVMVSTAGSRLMQHSAMDALKNRLIPIADIITPNLSEAEALTEINIESADDMEAAARKLGVCSVIKGGHLEENANDLLYINGECFWVEGARIDNPNTHGTGCTLSSAIACNLAMGCDIKTAVINAKRYITNAISANLKLGKGRGPLNHCVEL